MVTEEQKLSTVVAIFFVSGIGYDVLKRIFKQFGTTQKKTPVIVLNMSKKSLKSAKVSLRSSKLNCFPFQTLVK